MPITATIAPTAIPRPLFKPRSKIWLITIKIPDKINENRCYVDGDTKVLYYIKGTEPSSNYSLDETIPTIKTN